MTREEATKAANDISRMAGDNEHAHFEEDKLRENFLIALSCGNIEPGDVVEIAKIVLSTSSIDFPRWYA